MDKLKKYIKTQVRPAIFRGFVIFLILVIIFILFTYLIMYLKYQDTVDRKKENEKQISILSVMIPEVFGGSDAASGGRMAHEYGLHGSRGRRVCQVFIGQLFHERDEGFRIFCEI